MLAGYCAAVAGDAAAAGLAASLAREEGIADELALRVLDSVAMAAQSHSLRPARHACSLLDYRFLELMGPVNGEMQVLDKGRAGAARLRWPAASASDVRLRTAAAEAALRLNAMPPEAVADVYRRQPSPREELADPPRGRDPLLRRAQLFRAIEADAAHRPSKPACCARCSTMHAARAVTYRRRACWRRC